MPIPKVKSGEEEQEFISRCIKELYDEYGQEQGAAICYSQWRDKDKMSEDFARTKFEFPPESKETMTSFMARCMSNHLVRERKRDRAGRAAFCYGNYQNRYITSLAKRWK